MFPIKIMSSFLSLTGPIGAGKGVAASGTTSLIESFVLGRKSVKSTDIITQLSPSFMESVAKVTEQLNNKCQVFKVQLDDIRNALNQF